MSITPLKREPVEPVTFQTHIDTNPRHYSQDLERNSIASKASDKGCVSTEPILGASHEGARRPALFVEIIGHSPALQKVFEKVSKVAKTDCTVLIEGESGTGKELFARALHAASQRRSRTLVTVNCAAIPADLVESEFFGHEKGAFTGAIARKTGRFELANGGTLFLDEIGELPLDLQVKLLRVLQEQEFESVGGTVTKKVDVRVIAATNRDLAGEIRKGTFREDLFYRLNIFPVRLPPLRARREDIPALVNALIEKHAGKLGRKIDSVSPSAIERLCSHTWPGNVRELENIVERALILSSGTCLEIDDEVLPKPITDDRLIGKGDMGDDLSLRRAEHDHILAILNKTGWIIEGARGAARLLDLKPSTLRSRMKKMGLMRKPLTGVSGVVSTVFSGNYSDNDGLRVQ